MDLNELDFENVGSWPALYRGVFIAIVCILLSGAFFYYVTHPQLDKLESIKQEESNLKNQFKAKAALSANLEAHRAQMLEINIILDGLLNKLPSKAEIASLLPGHPF